MADVTLKYHGDRVASGEMDAAMVGGSIISFGTLCNLLTKEAYSAEAEVRTTIKGLHGGCFDVQFGIYLTGVVATLANQNPIPLPDLIRDVLSLYQHLRGKKAEEVNRRDDATVEVKGDNNVVMIFQGASFDVANSVDGAKAVDGFVRTPLSTVADRIEFTGEDVEPLEITRDQADSFKLPPPDPVEIEQPIENEIITVLDIDGVMFREGNKWRFFDGSDHFAAIISDPRYMAKVGRREEVFAAGDRLKVRLRITDKFHPKRTRDYEIVEVLEHRKPPPQLGLFT